MRPAVRLLAIVSALAVAFGLAHPGPVWSAPWAPQAGQAAADTARFTFEVDQRGAVEADFDAFAAAVSAILGDGRGWPRAGLHFQPVETGGDFTVVLASPAEVDTAHEVCDAQWNCRVGNTVLINDVRWRQASDAWTGTLADYRRYAVNHEVGHWVGLGHADCPGADDPAPVMQQQSISLQGCAPNPWPLQGEVEEVAARHGTTPSDPSGGDLPGVVRDDVWHLREQRSGGPADISFVYGRADDIAAVGDWNGDGQRTPGVVRGREWHLRNAHSGGPAQVSFRYGRADDAPVAGDWNGDGADSPGVVRDGRAWHLREALAGGSADVSFTYGRPGDVPIVGDWNGDGRHTPGVFRDGRWHLRNALAAGSADVSFTYGRPGDVPIVGDWNGDGVETPGVIRGREWHLRNALAGGPADESFSYGRSDDAPVTWR